MSQRIARFSRNFMTVLLSLGLMVSGVGFVHASQGEPPAADLLLSTPGVEVIDLQDPVKGLGRGAILSLNWGACAH